MTMLCFTCKSEYPRGVRRCAECGVMLVYRFPSDPAPPLTQLVVVRKFNSSIDANLARMALTAAGIESLLRSDDCAGGALPHMSFISGIEMLVRFEDAQDAEAILNIDATGSEAF
jgi:hypothetical protein